MRKPSVIALAALIGFGSLASEAKAGDGGAIAAGIIGGLAVGALAGSAIADSHRPRAYVYHDDYDAPVYRPSRRVHVYRYGYAPYYGDYPAYGYGDYYGSWYDY